METDELETRQVLSFLQALLQNIHQSKHKGEASYQSLMAALEAHHPAERMGSVQKLRKPCPRLHQCSLFRSKSS